MKSRGQVLEEDLKRSAPEGVRVLKLNTPVPPTTQMEAVIEFLKARGADSWMVGALSGMKFTPRQPFDLLISAPRPAWTWHSDRLRDAKRVVTDALAKRLRRCAGAGDDPPVLSGDEIAVLVEALAAAFGRPQPVKAADINGGIFDLVPRERVVLVAEVKSTKLKRLDYAMIRDHQIAGLSQWAAAGHIAGLIIELQAIDGGAVYFLPVQTFAAYRSHREGASIPAAEIARLGIRIEVDPSRGRVHRYYRLGRFLRLFGADVEAEEEL